MMRRVQRRRAAAKISEKQSGSIETSKPACVAKQNQSAAGK